MDRQEYMAWLSEIDELSADQRAEAGRALAEQPSLEAVIGLLVLLSQEFFEDSRVATR